MNRTANRLQVLWLCVIAALVGCIGLACVTPAASADEDSATTSTGTGEITVDYHGTINGKSYAMDGVDVALYRAADWQTDGTLELTDEFAALVERNGIDGSLITNLETLSDQNVQRSIAGTLESYIKAAQSDPETYGEAPAALATQVTDADGNVTFTGLENALYYVVAGNKYMDVAEHVQRYCDGGSMFAELSTLYVTDGVSQRSLSLEPKVTCGTNVDPVQVKKVWDDEDNKDGLRASSVSVSLYMLPLADDEADKGGVEGDADETPSREYELVDTVTLSADNDWTYVWDNLPEHEDYYLVENGVSDKYNVTITQEDVTEDSSTFVITNSYTPETVVPPAPTPEPTPTKPAQTGASIAMVAVVAIAALALGALLVIEARRARKA